MDNQALPSTHQFSYQGGYPPGQSGYSPGQAGYTPGAPPPGWSSIPPLAGIGSRFLALLIDSVIVSAIMIVGYVLTFVFFFGGAATHTDEGSTLGGLLGSAVFLIFFGLALGIWLYNEVVVAAKNNGQTIGKKMMKVRIVKEDGTSFGYGDGFLRNIIGHWISGFICYLGYFWALWDPKKQCWHDKIFKTVVVQA